MANTRTKTLPPEETALFCEQIAMVLQAGIPLHDGLETLAQSYAGTAAAEAFTAIGLAVSERGQLSDALRASGLFPDYLCGMTRLGENAGRLENVMTGLASYYAWEADTRRSVKNAILYPAALVLLLGAVIAILVVSVLPVFSRVFAGLGLGAGTPQAALMRVGVGVGKGALILTGAVLLCVALIAVLLQTGRRGQTLDALKRLFPPVREASFKQNAGRLSGALSILLSSGVDLGEALSFAPAVVSDTGYAARLNACRERVRDGAPFAEAVSEQALFDPLHLRMVRFGAKAGQLDTVFSKLSEIYRDETDAAVHRLVSFIEPALVTALSLVIGGILLSVTLPLLSILSALA